MSAEPAVSNLTEREQFIDEIFEGIVALVDARLKDVWNKLRDIERHKPPEKGDKGEPGPKGDTPAIDYEALHKALEPAVAEWLAGNAEQLRGAPGSPGEPAVSVDVAALAKEITDAVLAKVPPREELQGEKGDPGAAAVIDSKALDDAALAAVEALDIRKLVKEVAGESIGEEVAGAVAFELPKLALPKGDKGDPGEAAPPVDLDQVAQRAWAMTLPVLEKRIAEEADKATEHRAKLVAEAVAAIPKPKDAEPVDYVRLLDWVGERVRKEFEDRKEALRGAKGDPGGVGRPGEPGQPGKPGPPGRDAFDGEHIKRVLVEQFAGVFSSLTASIEQVDERNVRFGIALGSKQLVSQTIHFDVLVYRGVWKESEPNNRGDVRSWDGSAWHCNVDNCTSKPRYEDCADWTLMAKRGRDGIRERTADPPSGPPKPLSLR